MGRFRLLAVLAFAVVAAFSAQAKIGTCDAVLAATLLLPYFEVDLNGADEKTTLFFINNVPGSAVIAHVSLWTDYGVGTATFDVNLTGGDVQAINLRDVFTGSAIPGITVSTPVTELVPAHTGQVSPTTSKVSGYNHGDNVARGYVLVDVVNQANAGFPYESGYFVAGGNGKASNANVLWGDYLYVDQTNNFSEGGTLVHIEASNTDPSVITNGSYTFYGAFVNGTAADNREPLGTSWAVSYDIADFYHPTDLIYWRDSKTLTSPLTPGMPPGWWPLSQNGFLVYDESGNAHDPGNSHLLPLVCGSVDVAGDDVGAPYDRGSVFLNLNSTTSGPVFGTVRQSYVSRTKKWEGRFSVGHGATQLVHASEE